MLRARPPAPVRRGPVLRARGRGERRGAGAAALQSLVRQKCTRQQAPAQPTRLGASVPSSRPAVYCRPAGQVELVRRSRRSACRSRACRSSSRPRPRGTRGTSVRRAFSPAVCFLMRRFLMRRDMQRSTVMLALRTRCEGSYSTQCMRGIGSASPRRSYEGVPQRRAGEARRGASN